MVGLIAGMLLAVGYTADVEITADKKYPDSYSAFKKGFITSFREAFIKRSGRSPSDALSEDCCKASFSVITEYLAEGRGVMTDDKMQLRLVLTLFLPLKVEERMQKECEALVNKHLKAGTVYK